MGKDTIIILLFFMFVANLQSIQTQNIDINVLRNVNQGAPGLKPLSRVVSETTVPLSLSLPVLMGGYSLITSDKELFKDAFYIALASGVNLGMTLSLKEMIGRQRPYESYPDMLEVYKLQNDFSMPSGHSSGAFATATALSMKYPKWYVIVPSFAWAGAVGYSRMHLGAHYPSDVLAGAVLGAGSAWISWKVNQWIWSNYDIQGLKIIKR
jgi:membrane-associated phospholipid phosphatase